jgi:type IV secretory pathway TraG/TraD family ATPase VirD4
MADRTRSSILAGVMGILHTFNTGVVRLLVSTTTTISPDDLFKGKWILVDMAPTEWGDAGKFVAAGWKYLAQRAILRRHVKEGDNIVTIWCDEAWQFFNSFDAHFIAQCRSHQGSLVYLTQSRQSYYAAMKGQAGRHEADAFLANFQHKVFHSLGDVETSEWACSLVGRSLQNFFGGSSQQESSVFDELFGTGSQTASFSEHFEAVLQPNAFLHGLRTGGPANDLLCDAIIVRSGTPFSSGQNWIKVSFSQR